MEQPHNKHEDSSQEIDLEIVEDEETQVNEQPQETHVISHFLEVGEFVDYLNGRKWTTVKIVDIQNSSLSLQSADLAIWVQFDYETIRKQWVMGIPPYLSRVDVHNDHRGWIEGIIQQVDKDRVLVHHIGYKKCYDQHYSLKDIAPLGYHTAGPGIGKLIRQFPASLLRLQHRYNSYVQLQNLIAARRRHREIEISLHTMLSEQSMFVKEVQGDGNCMFRAISDQLYGTEMYHKELRKFAMKYIQEERNYFQDYIINGDVDAYVEYKGKDGVWGDNIELQAFREMYDIPIEIYVCSKEPLKTGLESNPLNKEPIKLSYHGRSHYNSIKHKEKVNSALLGNVECGHIEQMMLEKAKEHQFKEPANVRAQFENCISNELDVIFNESKRLFTEQVQKNEQTAIQESLLLKEQEEDEEQLMDMVIKQSEQEVKEESIESQILQSVMEQSKKDQDKQMMDQFEDTQFQKIVETAMYEDPMNNPVIAQVMSMGAFGLEQVLEAYVVYGNDPEMIINYLYENFQ